MIKPLSIQSFSVKFLITVYLLLTSLAFGVAALMSHDRYGFDHQRTEVYYLGNEAEMAFPKLYSQLIQSAHVHIFMMPVIFLLLWVFMEGTSLSVRSKVVLILGGAFSILIYNAAPFMVRYLSVDAVWMFTIGGIGLFGFYILPALYLLTQLWKKPV